MSNSALVRLPPGPKEWPLVGSTLAFFRDILGFQRRMKDTYGDITRFSIGGGSSYFVAHPDLIRDVLVTESRKFTKGEALRAARRVLGNGLVTAEGDEHRRNRRLLAPMFRRQMMHRYASVMSAQAQACANRWPEDRALDISHEMTETTLRIITQTMFHADTGSDARALADAIAVANSMIARLVIPGYSSVEWIPTRKHRAFKRAKNFLGETLQAIIRARRDALEKDESTPDDLLGLLIQARDVEGDGGGLSDSQIFDEVVTLFAAGHETVATGMTWGWVLLSKSPEWQDRVHEEVTRVCGDKPVGIDELAQMPIVRAVVSEILRMYPPVFNIARRVEEPVQIGGYLLPVGAIVLMSPFVTHRDERFFENPESFDPSRWFDGWAPVKYSYFPFGGGPRVCIGENFALCEMAILFATFLRACRVSLVAPDDVKPQLTITYHPKGAVPARVSRRRI